MVNYLIVNFQKRIEFINECNCIVDLNELEQAILWYQSKPTASVKKIYLHGNYPAVSIHNQKIHIHRLLMQYWLNTKLPFEYSVHHLNENKLDARKENLSLILNSAHNSATTKEEYFQILTEKKLL